MKIGLYFGSFNPIHIGHLIIASCIVENSDVQKIWFVLSPQNPLKDSSTLLNEYHRLHLLRLAIEDDSRFSISEAELKLPTPSYTINTLTYLSDKHPNHTFSIIMGSDSYLNLSRWKNYQSLVKYYSIIVYERPGYIIEDNIHNALILKAPLIEISSTLIREKIKMKKSIKYLVPEKVYEELTNNSYYK